MWKRCGCWSRPRADWATQNSLVCRLTLTNSLLSLCSERVSSVSSDDPEERARVEIDAMVTAPGWVVSDYTELNPSAGRGIDFRASRNAYGQSWHRPHSTCCGKGDKPMISRFQGEGGQARLIAVLRAQRTISDEETLAKEIAKIACLIQLEPNTPTSEFIKQGATDNDIYLILEGKVSIRVNGREVAVRVSGYHVGEMALIDPTARRSASVVAVEQTVLAKVSEASFASLANQFPQLWRRLALDLAERLRHRGRFVSSPNPQPVLFVGSSVERHPVASEIQSGLRNDRMIVIVWADDVFRASKSSVESLLATVLSSDFAVLLIAPDDIVMSRDIESPAPRDNVVWELGLLMGLLGRERTFIVRPRGANIKLPSDWLDFKPLEYAEGTPDTLESRVAPICNEIRKAIQKLGPI